MVARYIHYLFRVAVESILTQPATAVAAWSRAKVWYALVRPNRRATTAAANLSSPSYRIQARRVVTQDVQNGEVFMSCSSTAPFRQWSQG